MTERRLLLVEDDPVVSEMVAATLVDRETVCRRVNTVRSAIEALDQEAPDLLLLDFLLPDGNAFDLLNRLACSRDALPPFIILTGCGDEHIAVEMMKRGARDYLVKDQRFLDVLPLTVEKTFRDLRVEEDFQRTRELLRQSEESLRCTFDQASVGMVFFGLDGRLHRCNRRYAEIVGYPYESLANQTFQQLTHPEDVSRQLALIEQLISGAANDFTIEKRYLSASGAVTWANISVSIVKTPHGGVSHLFAVVEDITEEKLLISQLQEEESHLLLAQELGKIASFDWNLATGKIDWTPQGFEMLEREAGSFEQSIASWFAFVHPDDRSKLQSTIDTVLSGGPNPGVGYRLVMPDGRSKHVLTKGEVIVGEDGRPNRIVGVTQDITEQVMYESMLEESRRKAEAANRAKSEFLANMSHEIRTPLNGVLGMLQLVNDSKLDAEQKEYIDLAIYSSQRLMELLNDLLDLARIEAGRVELYDEPFVLQELLDSCIALFKPQAVTNGVDLNGEVAAVLPDVIVGDSTRIRQILFNLVGNAVKFTPSGEVRVTFELFNIQSVDRFVLQLTVADSGIGMSAEMVEQAFEPFTQEEEGRYQRKVQGAGLGLSIVKRLVELMKGEVAIESRKGAGTTVTVRMEVGRAPSAVDEVVPKGQKLPLIQQSQHCLRILLAEDNEINRVMLVKMLQKDGHAVIAVESGEKALQALQNAAIDLVMMDIQMGEMDGLEATRRIRSDQSGRFNPKLPVIAVTAYAMPMEQEEFLKNGIDACLTKPISLDCLRAVLQRFTPSHFEPKG